MVSYAFGRGVRSLWRGPIARGTALSLAIRIAGLGVGFVQAVLVARLLGPEGYGASAFAIALVTIASTLSMLGFGGLSVREMAHLIAHSDWPRLRGYLRVAVTSVIGASVLAAIGLAVLAQRTEAFESDVRPAVTSATLLVLPMALLGLFSGIARGCGWIVAAQAPTMLLRPGIIVTLLCVAVLTGIPLDVSTYLGFATAAAFVAATVAGILLVRALWTAVRAVPAQRESGAWRRAAVPFLGISAIAMLYTEINTLMLGWLAGTEEAGLFQPLARLSALMLLGVQAAGMRYGPRVSEYWARGDIVNLKHVTGLMSLATMLATATTCAAILATAPWILAAFGPEFVGNVPALWWIAAAQIFTTGCGPVNMLLTMTEHSLKALAALTAAVASNVALALWLIPAYGAHGAAQAMAVGIVVWSVASLLFVRRSLKFDPSLIGALRRKAFGAAD